MKDVALEYTDMGIGIIPMNPESKSPHLMSWKEYQTKKPTRDEVEKWWDTWPKAMIGLVTGNLNGICLVDVDSVEAGKWLKENVPDIGNPHAKTPRPGWHYYFRSPNELRCCNGIVHPKIDIKAEGGLAIIPPSSRGNGKAYQFIDPDFDFKSLLDLPINLCNIIYSSSSKYNNCKDCASNGVQQAGNKFVTNVTFSEPGRDETLFHLANHLVKGGMPDLNIRKYLHFFASHCDPVYTQKEAEVKIKSALDRKKNQEKSFYEEVKDWVCNTDVTIMLQDGYNSLHCVTREDKAKLRVYFQRLVNENVLIKVGTGRYKLKKDNLEWLDIENADTEPFKIVWPGKIEELINMPKGGIALVAGQVGAGKTTYLLNLAKMNMNRKMDVIFISTETNAQGLRIRLEGFGYDGISIKDLTKGIKFAYHEEGELAEVIEVHDLKNSIIIIDYLEVENNFWQVGEKLSAIFRKMDKGIAIVGLQMKGQALLGGNFGFHKPEIVLTLKKTDASWQSKATIEKCRWPAKPGENPLYKSLVFSLKHGCIVHPLTEWERESNGKTKVSKDKQHIQRRDLD